MESVIQVQGGQVCCLSQSVQYILNSGHEVGVRLSYIIYPAEVHREADAAFFLPHGNDWRGSWEGSKIPASCKDYKLIFPHRTQSVRGYLGEAESPVSMACSKILIEPEG